MFKRLYHCWIISRSGIFDPNYYLLNYPDVRKADINPLWHFVKYGWKERRNPTGYFDTKFYIENNPDVLLKDINPLVHYIKFGLKEGRKPRPVVENSLFDTNKEFKNVYPLDLPHASADVDIEEIKQIDAVVSVIIPTKNGGDEFEFLLKMLINQIGIKDIEIVIVDSGSQDKTLSLAIDYGAKVITIPSEKFSHSFSRNLGAENATGDYLLFTVQDALPPTKTWLYELLTVLIKNDVSAVSCAEMPRENADLFYRVISWNHYKFLGVLENDRVFSLPENSDHLTLRKNGQLSDLACLIRHDLFMQYKYRLNYAEDLDLGIRLIKDGHKLAFLGSIRIIHSHNRSAFYFLKRGYVDNLFLSDIFSDFIIPRINIKDLVPAIIFNYNFLNQEVIEKAENLELPIKTEELISFIENAIISRQDYKSPLKIPDDDIEYINQQLFNFLKDLINIYPQSKIDSNQGDILIQPLMGYLQITFDYLRGTYEIIDKPLLEELKSCLVKEFSILIGAYLAYCYLNSTSIEKNSLNILHNLLADGI